MEIAVEILFVGPEPAEPFYSVRVDDGAAALAHLARSGRVRLIYVDSVDAVSIVRQIKTHPTSRRVPVIVFVSPGAAETVHGCYEVYANAIVEKPADAARLRGIIDVVTRFWLTTASLPPT